MSNISQIAESISRENPHLFIFPCGGSHPKSKLSLPTKKGNFHAEMEKAGIFRVTGVSGKGRDGFYWGQNEPDKVRTMFEYFGRSARQIGVWLNQSNKIVFDVDIYNASEGEQKHRELKAFVDKWSPYAEMVVKTQSGGYHLWFTDDDPDKKRPQIWGGKIDIKASGLALFPFEGSGYTILEGSKWNSGATPPEGIWEVLHAPEHRGGSSGGALPPSDLAIAILEEGRGNVGGASRHDSMMRVVKDLYNANPLGSGDTEEGYKSKIGYMFMDMMDEPRFAAIRDAKPERIECWLDEGTGTWEGDAGRAIESEWDYRTDPKSKKYYGDWHPEPPSPELMAAKMQELLASSDLPLSLQEALKDSVGKPASSAAVEVDDILDIKIENLESDELPDIEWLVKDFLAVKNLASISGPSGAGKTRFVSFLMACIATGRTDLLGFDACEPSACLYVANEERAGDIHRRIKSAAALNGITEPGNVAVIGKKNFSMVHEDKLHEANYNRIRDIMEDRKVKFIVFDPYITLGGPDEMSPQDNSIKNTFMLSLAEETGACVMHVHHSPKDRSKPADDLRGQEGAWRGHGSIYSALDWGYSLFPYYPDNLGKGSRLEGIKKIRRAQANKDVGKYVVMDTGKVREGGDIAPFIMKFDEASINRTGVTKIGGLKVSNEKSADFDMGRVIEIEAQKDMTSQKPKEFARAIHKKWKTNQTVPKQDVHDWLVSEIPAIYGTGSRFKPARESGVILRNEMRNIPVNKTKKLTVVDAGQTGFKLVYSE